MSPAGRNLLGHLDEWAKSESARHHDPQVTESILRMIACRDAYRVLHPYSGGAQQLTDLIAALADPNAPRWTVLPLDVQSALIVAAAA